MKPPEANSENYGSLWYGQPVPLRIPVNAFEPSKSQKNVLRMNRGVAVRAFANVGADPYCEEQNRIACEWMRVRHGHHPRDFSGLGINSEFLSFMDTDTNEPVGGMLFERQEKGVFASVFFYDPALHQRSLGTFAILALIEHAAKIGFPYVKMGTWHPHPTSRTGYKIRFQPCELLINGRWTRYTPTNA